MRHSSLLRFLTITAVLAVLCGGCQSVDDSSRSGGSRAASDLSSAFEVSVSGSGGDVTVPVNSYPRNGVEQESWTSGPDSFDHLDTYQFVLDKNETFTGMTARINNDDMCLSAFRGSDFAVIDKGGDVGSPIFESPTSDAPVQITFMPWRMKDRAGGCDLANNFDAYEASIAYAVWLSVNQYWDTEPDQNEAIICKLDARAWANAFDGTAPKGTQPATYTPTTDNQGLDPVFSGSTDDCVIDQIGSQSYNGTDVWAGTLFTMLTTSSKKILFIDLGDNQTFEAIKGQVLNSEYWDGGSWNVIDTDMQIIVTGTSRIDGSGVIASGDNVLLGEMLVLASRSEGSDASPFAIDVSGVAVSNSPSIGHAPVRLNDATLPMYAPGGSFSWDANNYPVKAYDFKRPGTWLGASDAIEPGGDGSLIQHAYMHVSDDAIKVSAGSASAPLTYQDVTMLKGGAAGEVMNLGSYGFSRGVTGATIDGVYVHRIVNSAGGDLDDGLGGIVSTRTCPFKTFSGTGTDRGGRPQTITGIWIKNVYVNALGFSGDGKTPWGGQWAGAGPNQTLRAFAIGVMGSSDDRWSPFCSDHGAEDDPAQVTIGDWTISNFNIFMNPLEKSKMYDHEMGRGIDTVWQPIRFCDNYTADVPEKCPQNPVPAYGDEQSPLTIWPYGMGGQVGQADNNDGPPAGYYVCGVPDDMASQCWNVDPAGQAQEGEQGTKGTASNVTYDYKGDDNDPDHWTNILVFPFGPA